MTPEDYAKLIPPEAVEAAAIAMCQNSLAGKRCPCIESGKFNCANEYPGRQARAACAAMLAAWPGVAWEQRTYAFSTNRTSPPVETLRSTLILPLPEVNNDKG